MSTRDPQRTWRRQAILSGVLVLVALVLAHRLNRGVTGARWDLTEEQLSVPSPVGVRMLRELEDVLEVRAFFTGEVELGIAQLAKRRLVDQLEEAKRLSSGRLALAFRDPNKSSEARAEAYALGIVSQAIGAVQGTGVMDRNRTGRSHQRHRIGDVQALGPQVDRTAEDAIVVVVQHFHQRAVR